MKDIHMNPEEAVQAHLDLEAERSIGMHFGTFQLTPEGIDEPVRALAAARRARGVAETAFVTLESGASLRLKARWSVSPARLGAGSWRRQASRKEPQSEPVARPLQPRPSRDRLWARASTGVQTCSSWFLRRRWRGRAARGERRGGSRVTPTGWTARASPLTRGEAWTDTPADFMTSAWGPGSVRSTFSCGGLSWRHRTASPAWPLLPSSSPAPSSAGRWWSIGGPGRPRPRPRLRPPAARQLDRGRAIEDARPFAVARHG